MPVYQGRRNVNLLINKMNINRDKNIKILPYSPYTQKTFFNLFFTSHRNQKMNCVNKIKLQREKRKMIPFEPRYDTVMDISKVGDENENDFKFALT